MSDIDDDLLASARLETARQRLFGLLPAHLRSRDAAEGDPLAALVAVMASGIVELDDALDAMADAMFVETADAAGLDDLAEVVAATPLAPLPAGAGHDLRAYVANTLARRAGKGTAAALEGLAGDVSGLPVMVVEYFQRLARTENLIDVRADRPGVARLRLGETAGQAGTALDRLPRLANLRGISGRTHGPSGRHHVPHVGVHVRRGVVPTWAAPPGDGLDDAVLAGVPAAAPWGNMPGLWQLAAMPGGVIRLFNPDRRSASSNVRNTDQALPGRLARLPLHLECRERRQAAAANRLPRLPGEPWFADDAPFTVFVARGGTWRRVHAAAIRIANLEALPAGRPLDQADGGPVECVIDPVTGRLGLPAGAAEVTGVRVAHASGRGRAIGAGPQERNSDDVPFDIVDTPELAHFIRIIDSSQPGNGAPTDQVRRVPSLADAVADWNQHGGGWPRGLLICTRCDREAGAVEILVNTRPDSELHIIAAQWRPRVVRPGVADDPARHGHIVRRDRMAIIDVPLRLLPVAAPPAGGRAGRIVLDGLWLAAGLRLSGSAVSDLWLRHCTARAPGNAPGIEVTTALAGGTLRLSDCISGRVRVPQVNATGRISIRDTVLARDGSPNQVLDTPALDADLANVTLIGPVRVKSLEATNILFTQPVTVARTQVGCVRYSHVPADSQVPRRFRCQPDLALSAAAAAKGSPLLASEALAVRLGVAPRFLDTDLDEPSVAMLHPLASPGLRLGGEGDAEMGAFARSAEGLRLANVRRLFAESLAVGLAAGIIDDTRSTAAANRRNRP